MKMTVKDFLRRLPEFKNYLKYPELNLPTTVNVIESVNSFIRRKAKTVNSPKAWHKWATAAIRFRSIFTCK
jgi:transposase-like protein